MNSFVFRRRAWLHLPCWHAKPVRSISHPAAEDGEAALVRKLVPRRLRNAAADLAENGGDHPDGDDEEDEPDASMTFGFADDPDEEREIMLKATGWGRREDFQW